MLDLPSIRGDLVLEPHHDMAWMRVTQHDMICYRIYWRPRGVAREAEEPSS